MQTYLTRFKEFKHIIDTQNSLRIMMLMRERTRLYELLIIKLEREKDTTFQELYVKEFQTKARIIDNKIHMIKYEKGDRHEIQNNFADNKEIKK